MPGLLLFPSALKIALALVSERNVLELMEHKGTSCYRYPFPGRKNVFWKKKITDCGALYLERK